MFIFQPLDRIFVVGFHLGKGVVPVLIEFLIFHDVGLLHLLSFLGLIVDQFLSSSLEILSLQLLNSVFSHLGLYQSSISLLLWRDK